MLSQIENMIKNVKFLLERDPLTRKCDIYLQFKILELMGLAYSDRHHRWGSVWVVPKRFVINGTIPCGVMETIRRSRQKIQENDSSLCDPETAEKRKKIAERVRTNIRKLEF